MRFWIFFIQLKKKKKHLKFSKITVKNNFWAYNHFLENVWSDDKNEYDLFYRRRGTQYGFEIFSSKTHIPAEWKPKNQFLGHIFLHIGGSIGPIVSKKT